MTYDDGRLLLGIVSTSKLNDDEVDSEESEWLGRRFLAVYYSLCTRLFSDIINVWANTNDAPIHLVTMIVDFYDLLLLLPSPSRAHHSSTSPR